LESTDLVCHSIPDFHDEFALFLFGEVISFEIYIFACLLHISEESLCPGLVFTYAYDLLCNADGSCHEAKSILLTLGLKHHCVLLSYVQVQALVPLHDVNDGLEEEEDLKGEVEIALVLREEHGEEDGVDH